MNHIEMGCFIICFSANGGCGLVLLLDKRLASCLCIHQGKPPSHKLCWLCKINFVIGCLVLVWLLAALNSPLVKPKVFQSATTTISGGF